MLKKCIAACVLLGLTAQAADKEIDDFEGKNFSKIWKVEGEAFGNAPAAQVGRQAVIEKHYTKKLANSFHKDDAGQGKMTSSPFKIEKKYITFLIGGGKHKGKTCLNLIIDGKVTHSETGDNSNTLRKAHFDVSKHIGKNAVLEIVDSFSGGWGYVMVDQLAQSDSFSKSKKRSVSFKVPDNYDVDLFAGNEYVDNPIAISIDTKGRVYVAEALRFLRGVEDTRRYNAWFMDELAINDLQGRMDLYEKWTKKGLFKEGHFTEYSERIQTIIDSDGDGKADKKKLYAGEFNHPLDGNGSSILLGMDGEMYYANIPHIWKLYDKDGDGISESREKLVSGFGFRNGVNGHDLHGLEWGVDGKLYFSNGDRGYGIKTKEGGFLFDSERGAVFRCDPDGSNLERFTIGNRNPQDLAFDQYGNMFTVDNNRGNGDRSRVCYLVELGDYSWNSGHENKTTFYRATKLNERKGPNAIDNWLTDGDWKTQFDGQAAYCIPSSYYIDGGSAGITFNPGKSLGPDLDDHFVYSAYQRGIFTFKFAPKGAGLEIQNVKNFWSGGHIMDTEFSTDGKLYVADYVSTSNAKKGQTKGAIYVLKEPEYLNHQSVKSADKILKGGFKSSADSELYTNLFHDDMRVRLYSQFELAKRKKADILEKALKQKENELARLHGLWGLGQLSRKDNSYNAQILPFVKDDNWRIRSQAAKVLGESKDKSTAETLLSLLNDSNMRVQFYAATAVGKVAGSKSVEPLIKLSEANADKDIYLRHSITAGLIFSGEKDKIHSYIGHSSPAVRRVVLLSLARLKDHRITELLNDSDSSIVTETIRAIDRTKVHAIVEKGASVLARYAKGKPDLHPSDMERIIQWNFRKGGLDSAGRLKDFALNEEASSRLRQIALNDLGRWHNDHPVDPVIGQIREINKDRGDVSAIAKEAVQKLLTAKNDKDMNALLNSMALEFGIGLDKNKLVGQILNEKEAVATRLDLYKKLLSAKDPQILAVSKKLISDPVKDMRVEAYKGLFSLDKNEFSNLIKSNGKAGTDLQVVYTVIGQVEKNGADELLIRGLKNLIRGRHARESQLELLTASEISKNKNVQKALAEYKSKLPKDDKYAEFSPVLFGGDAAAGRKLVYEMGVGQCIICHKVEGKGGIVAPDLSNIGSEKRATSKYLLESLIEPSAFVLPGFGNISVTLKNGESVVGSLVKEDTEKLTLKLADGKTKIVAVADVKAKTPPISSMPPMGQILKKHEIRDIIAYLQSLKGGAAH
ncbi:MAG: HEAT repeat domain-containing protein [Lentisphaeraceae bacterium]|nr:HEAT repeat domain-containing protein [Lentisphaeraceae bacterium]